MDTTSKIDIIRMSTSSYQGEDFQEREKEALQQLVSVNYKDKINPTKPHILITNSNTRINELSVNENTKLIIHPNSGYDNFDLDFVRESPCPIIIGNEIRMNAVVGYTISALMNHLGKISSVKEWDKSRLWDRDLLEDKRILIIGLGHIGSKVRTIIESLGGSPFIHDPFVGHNELDFKDVDVILLCASLNPKSKNIINAKALAQVSPNLTIVNGARGELIDQQALIEFLRTNSNSYAALDVFEKEPFIDRDFSELKNVCLTSHIAGVHNQLNSNIIKFEYRIIESFLSINTIDKFKEINKKSLLQARVKDGFLI